MSVGYQSFYQAQLTAGISDTDLTIPLDVAPSPSEGFLVIESTVTDKREIIYYTSKTPTSVTCPSGGRGYDGTTATTHQQNAVVIMAPVGAMFDELRTQFTTTPQGWTSVVPTITDVTNNGNRSYTLTHSASVAAVISEGMRRRFQRTVATNTYMGGLMNGSSHYFTKTSPSGTLGTVTNNFTIEAYSRPGAYAIGMLCGRLDATAANGLFLRQEATGQISVAVYNGGAGNSRIITTYQSVSLTKSQHITATWTSGTVVIYFDGVSAPVQAATTAGTAPTTAGTGGDWSIGRAGAYAGQYFPGYISNVAVFDAVLSAATIREHATRKLLGNETNCIGAWSLDNTANDQSAAGNNLTATGGVGFSNVSPFGNNGKSSTLEYGLTMNVSSDGLTEVVQVPEGCALPTAITSQDYSTQGNPFGWVSDKGRWEVASIAKVAIVANFGGTNQWTGSSLSLVAPKGNFILGYSIVFNLWSSVPGIRSGKIALSSPSYLTYNGYANDLTSSMYSGASCTDFIITTTKEAGRNFSSSETITATASLDNATGTESWNVRGDMGESIIYLQPSGL